MNDSKVKKTVMVYDQVGYEKIKFLVLNGDYSHLDRVYVNYSPERLSNELCNLIYDQQGEFKEGIECSINFPSHLGDEIKNGECVVIVCGFPP